jgi:hypothetical protein
MLGYGLITTRDWPDTRLDYAAWLAFRQSQPGFRPVEQLRLINPFTKEPFVVPSPGSADVIQDGTMHGRFIWEDGRILLDGDPDVLTPLARLCADALGAELQDEDGDDL